MQASFLLLDSRDRKLTLKYCNTLNICTDFCYTVTVVCTGPLDCSFSSSTLEGILEGCVCVCVHARTCVYNRERNTVAVNYLIAKCIHDSGENICFELCLSTTSRFK